MINTIRAHFAGTGPAYDDLVAARDHLLADPRCTGKIGLVGFCMVPASAYNWHPAACSTRPHPTTA